MTTNTSSTRLSAYDHLLLQFRPKPISSRSQYDRVMRQIDGLMRKRKRRKAEEDLLEVLAMLAAGYEQHAFPAPDVAPSDVLAHLIEVRGLTKAELARETGIARQTITNILNNGRSISEANRAKLGKFFGVSPSLFVKA